MLGYFNITGVMLSAPLFTFFRPRWFIIEQSTFLTEVQIVFFLHFITTDIKSQ